jgi:cyclase
VVGFRSLSRGNMNVRVIPRLDIKGPNLVKGVHLEGLRVLGKPERFARFYYESGADELHYQDAVASLYGRNSLLDIIVKTSKEIFIPLCVGGGLRSVEDIREVLRAGADKVAINTAAVRNPQLVERASRAFGSSTIVISIEAIRKDQGAYDVLIDHGREVTGRDAFEWAVQAVELGAGELLVTSIDREGTGKGYDLELIAGIATKVPVPVIACGGCGKVEHVSEAVVVGKADAVSMASILHYDVVEREAFSEDLEADEREGNTEFLKAGRRFTPVRTACLEEIKRHLRDTGIPCRLEAGLDAA